MSAAKRRLKMASELCDRCGEHKPHYRTAFVQGIYYKRICDSCVGDSTDTINGTAAGHARRRDYEDHAQDTVQPWDANGNPRAEFLRLYPESARKIYNKETLDKLKREI
jgi:hypothetical protein